MRRADILTTFMYRLSRNSGNLNLVEHSGLYRDWCTLTSYVDGQKEKRKIQSEERKRCSSYSCISTFMQGKLETKECAVNIVRLEYNRIAYERLIK